MVAQFKSTVCILPRSTVVLSGNHSFPRDRYQTEKKLEDKELLDLMSQPLWKKEKDAKKEKPAEAKKA